MSDSFFLRKQVIHHGREAEEQYVRGQQELVEELLRAFPWLSGERPGDFGELFGRDVGEYLGEVIRRVLAVRA